MNEIDPVIEVIRAMREEGHSVASIVEQMAQQGFDFPDMELYVEQVSSPVN